MMKSNTVFKHKFLVRDLGDEKQLKIWGKIVISFLNAESGQKEILDPGMKWAKSSSAGTTYSGFHTLVHFHAEWRAGSVGKWIIRRRLGIGLIDGHRIAWFPVVCWNALLKKCFQCETVLCMSDEALFTSLPLEKGRNTVGADHGSRTRPLV